jgi:hypothetical protein
MDIRPYGALCYGLVVLFVVVVVTVGCNCGITSITAWILVLEALLTLVMAVLLLAFTAVTAVNPAAAVVPTCPIPVLATVVIAVNPAAAVVPT